MMWQIRPQKRVKNFSVDTVTLTDYYCPICGTQTMWQDIDEGGDIYVGCSARCDVCRFELSCLPEWDKTDVIMKREKPYSEYRH